MQQGQSLLLSPNRLPIGLVIPYDTVPGLRLDLVHEYISTQVADID